MKLLRFLERRLADPPPKSTLHKWIRSGQVRVNGGRAKPFSILAAGDAVRVPPFAAARELVDGPALPAAMPSDLQADDLAPGSSIGWSKGPALKVVDCTREIIVLAKPGGLPCQPGSGHQDSVSARLSEEFAGSAFIPAPAHRLDRNTTGLVVAGRSHAAQRWLHTLFREGGARKDYLAWVSGNWPHDLPCLLHDRLEQCRDKDGRERTRALPGGGTSLIRQNGMPRLPVLPAREKGVGLCIALPVQRISIQRTEDRRSPNAHGMRRNASGSLLLVMLLTGHKHQIRVQLASRGFPVVGDRHYRGADLPQMFLHAYALALPAMPARGGCPGQPAKEYILPPNWPSPFELDPAAAQSAREEMRLVLSLLETFSG